MRLIPIVVAAAGSCSAQDAVFTLQETTEANRYIVFAEFTGFLPTGTTSVDTVWSDINIRVTGDAPVTFDLWNPRYSTNIFGDPVIDGNGTTAASFTALMLGTQSAGFFGEAPPDSSNPLLAVSFLYEGSSGELGLELVGQNSAAFQTTPASTFDVVKLYQDALGSPGELTFRLELPFGQFPADAFDFFIPAPATVALAPVALLAAGRRRK